MFSIGPKNCDKLLRRKMPKKFLLRTEGQTDKRAEKQIDKQTERHTGVKQHTTFFFGAGVHV